MIEYINGDLTKHNFKSDCSDEAIIIPHVLNNEGVNKSGVIVPIFKKWPRCKTMCEDWYDAGFIRDDWGFRVNFQLGEVLFVNNYDEENNERVIIANMIGQKFARLISGKNFLPAYKEAVEEGIWRVKEFIEYQDSEYGILCKIVAPKFGSLRAGLSWENDIEPMIAEAWKNFDVTIYVFDENAIKNPAGKY